MRQRIIVCPIIENQGAILLCKMPKNRGVFPGQWALSGGGVEPGERLEEALKREVREELGDRITLESITPFTFSDDIRTKTYADGSTETLYMVYLIFDCRSSSRDVVINEEFEEFAWVEPQDLPRYDLNVATRATLKARGLLA
ncbi:nucleoside triphosphatase NudI [Salmonella enterica subsp. enterica serovar Choleraesuis]|nr:nucleoside triphosphatase NudI [Salmonella enterica subsp. enterica serovar Choleraesuis]